LVMGGDVRLSMGYRRSKTGMLANGGKRAFEELLPPA